MQFRTIGVADQNAKASFMPGHHIFYCLILLGIFMHTENSSKTGMLHYETPPDSKLPRLAFI
jgi:hypothetical protein